MSITGPIKLNANSVVTNSKGEILLVRLKKGSFAGALCIPGGGVHPGELSHEAARREVFEETGIDVQSTFTPFGFCELMSSTINQHKIVMLLYAHAEGVPQDTDEGEAAWCSYQDAEPEMLAFTREALRIWNEKKVHFTLTERDVDIRKEISNL